MNADVCGHGAIEQASQWVARFLPLIPQGRVLDLACGGGRHARLLASAGHSVLAVDRNAEALAAIDALGDSRICTRQVDLEIADDVARPQHWPLGPAVYTGIVVTNYLHRPLLPALFDSLVDGGVLIYETFAVGNGKYGKPSSPAFLLEPGELLRAAVGAGPDFRVIAFEDGFLSQPRPAMVQRVCVLRGRPENDSGIAL